MSFSHALPDRSQRSLRCLRTCARGEKSRTSRRVSPGRFTAVIRVLALGPRQSDESACRGAGTLSDQQSIARDQVLVAVVDEDPWSVRSVNAVLRDLGFRTLGFSSVSAALD